MTQLSFRASPVSIDADTTEISACQKMRTDGQTAFQLYIIDSSQVKLILTHALMCKNFSCY